MTQRLAPRSEKDELVAELRGWADGLLAKQGRLNESLFSDAGAVLDTDLLVVLRDIVDAARDLLDARYAALALFDANGQVEAFLHTGVGDDLAARLGALPRGRGLLAPSLYQSGPIRLADLTQHPAWTGFPPDHPPVRRFLGVPIRVGERVTGNFYFAEPTHGGEFTAADESLGVALAEAALGAITNVRMFIDSEQQRRWSAASDRLEWRLLAADSGRPFQAIAEEAMIAAGADCAAVSLPHGADQVIIAAASGRLFPMAGQLVALEGSLTAQIMRPGHPVLVTDHRDESQSWPERGVRWDVDGGPMVVVPLLGRDRVHGALSVGRLSNRPGFTDGDIKNLAAFGAQAALALEPADGGARQQAPAPRHEHCAGDQFEDDFVQELSAIAAGLRALAGDTELSERAQPITAFAEGLDRILSQVRVSHPARHAANGLGHRGEV